MKRFEQVARFLEYDYGRPLTAYRRAWQEGLAEMFHIQRLNVSQLRFYI